MISKCVWASLKGQCHEFFDFRFFSKFTLRCKQSDIIPLFATGGTFTASVVDTSGKFDTGVVDTASTTGVVDTCGAP